MKREVFNLAVKMPKQDNPYMSTERHLASAIDELTELFVLFDADDRIVLANRAWKELSKDVIDVTGPGVKFEDHLRAILNKGLIPDAVGCEEEWLAKRLERHFNPRGPFEARIRDGRWVLIHEQRLANNATVLTIREITEQKRVEEKLRQSEERFQAFINHLPAKMHIKDPLGRYLLINRVTEKLFGISNEEAIGKTVTDILPERIGEIFDSHDKTVLRTGVAITQEEEFETKDGVRTYLTVKFPIRDAKGNVAAVGASGIDITERKQFESLLRKQEQELNSVVESAPDNIIRYDLDCRVVFVNGKMEETVDVVSKNLIGKTPIEGKFEGQIGVENFEATLRQVISTGEPEEVDLLVLNPNGEQETHQVCLVAERGSDGKIIGALAFGRDITERKQAEEDLRIAAIAMDSQEAIAITDASRCIIKINQSFTRVTGYTAEDAIGHTLGELFRSRNHDEAFYDAMLDKLGREKRWKGEIWNRHKNGEVYPHQLHITAVTSDDDQVTHYVASFNDITQQKQAEEIIHNLAFFDPLTELPNRRLLQDRLEHTLASSARNSRHGAILFMDLDNFKELNDTKGHGVGDLLLVEVAKRLLTCVREDDTVARLGGDEFVIVLNDLHASNEMAAVQAETIAEKMRDAINVIFELQGQEYHSSPSIGISLFQGDEVSAEELLKRADTAMYQAKQSGRNTICFFDPETHAAMEARIALEADLRCALAENQLQLYYQMQVDDTGHIFGAEVLLRWHHPQRGLVSPLDFIPLAEDTGLIIPIGNWVMQTACEQIKIWESDPKAKHIQLAVNVSARQFHQPDFVEQAQAILEKCKIDPGKLKLELTESLVLNSVNDTITKMQALKKCGVSFSMDDFGTGYSSLSYLTQLPLDQLKIDQSFVRNIGTKSSDAVIVQTIIGMANNLHMDVIAEGVETKEQRNFLQRSGCSNYQGYMFGRPVPLEEFEATLSK